MLLRSLFDEVRDRLPTLTQLRLALPLRQTSCRHQIHADDPRRSDTKCKEIDIHQSFKNRP